MSRRCLSWEGSDRGRGQNACTRLESDRLALPVLHLVDLTPHPLSVHHLSDRNGSDQTASPSSSVRRTPRAG